MGLGAETVEVFYRAMQEREADVQRKRLEKLKSILTLHEQGEDVLRIAEDISTSDVFEAVRTGDLAIDQGSTRIYLARCAEWAMLPWPIRFLALFLGRRRWW